MHKIFRKLLHNGKPLILIIREFIIMDKKFRLTFENRGSGKPITNYILFTWNPFRPI